MRQIHFDVKHLGYTLRRHDDVRLDGYQSTYQSPRLHYRFSSTHDCGIERGEGSKRVGRHLIHR